MQNTNAPVKCSECTKVFATKYQAKKHFLRRHFKGERPYKCKKCNKKSFTVKEDLTMHMKACGQVFSCSCGIRLCSLGALKRHAKYFKHEPTSWEGQPVTGNDYGLMRGGTLDDGGVAGILLAAQDGAAAKAAAQGAGGEDESADEDEGVAPGTSVAARDVSGRPMMAVDVADGAAAQALLMADNSRVQFDPTVSSAMQPGLQPLYVSQAQAAAARGGITAGPEFLRQQAALQAAQQAALLNQQHVRGLSAHRPVPGIMSSPPCAFPGPCSPQLQTAALLSGAHPLHVAQQAMQVGDACGEKMVAFRPNAPAYPLAGNAARSLLARGHEHGEHGPEPWQLSVEAGGQRGCSTGCGERCQRGGRRRCSCPEHVLRAVRTGHPCRARGGPNAQRRRHRISDERRAEMMDWFPGHPCAAADRDPGWRGPLPTRGSPLPRTGRFPKVAITRVERGRWEA